VQTPGRRSESALLRRRRRPRDPASQGTVPPIRAAPKIMDERRRWPPSSCRRRCWRGATDKLEQAAALQELVRMNEDQVIQKLRRASMPREQPIFRALARVIAAHVHGRACIGLRSVAHTAACPHDAIQKVSSRSANCGFYRPMPPCRSSRRWRWSPSRCVARADRAHDLLVNTNG